MSYITSFYVFVNNSFYLTIYVSMKLELNSAYSLLMLMINQRLLSIKPRIKATSVGSSVRTSVQWSVSIFVILTMIRFCDIVAAVHCHFAVISFHFFQVEECNVFGISESCMITLNKKRIIGSTALSDCRHLLLLGDLQTVRSQTTLLTVSTTCSR